QAFFKVYAQAKTDPERQKLREKYPEVAGKLAPKFLGLARQHPNDPAALDALVWVASNVRGGTGNQNPSAQALPTLRRDHRNSDKLGPVCDRLADRFDPESQQFLHGLMEESPSKDVRGRACLALAMQLRNWVEAREIAPEYEAIVGKENMARLKKADPGKLNREAEDLFERAVTRFADLKYGRGTIGDRARSDLFEMRHRAAGKEAREVEGTDADGKQFKLSDYRGKVVLLDFWGNW